MTDKMIIDAYVRMRTIDNTIPDDVLDFMKDAALEKLKNISETKPSPLKQTEFRALMYCGKYVDAELIDIAIYHCSKPYIFDRETTIEMLKGKARQSSLDLLGKPFVSTKYFENLDKCQLVPVFITEPIQ